MDMYHYKIDTTKCYRENLIDQNDAKNKYSEPAIFNEKFW